MSSGQDHDKATMLWAMPFGLVIGILLDFQFGIIGSFAFAFGGLWLSPDLDTHCRALKRWGILKIVWWPYRQVIRHRSILSHGPLIGTSVRIIYLLIFTFLTLFVLQPFGFPTPFLALKIFNAQVSTYPLHIFIFILGLEASVWLHLIKDGDPLPLQWPQSKHK